MKILKKISLILSIILIIPAAIFLQGGAGKFIFSYFAEPYNHLRHEYIEGVIICTYIGGTIWAVAVALFVFYKK